MNSTIHSVAALSPEAFAVRKNSLFPCVPRYSRDVVMISEPDEHRP